MASNEMAEMPWEINEAGFPRQGPPEAQLRFLLRYAILAPSTRNTQPWKFRVEGDRMDIFADKDRWLRVADADQRELYISLGAALENLLVACRHFGLGYQVAWLPDPGQPDLAAQVRLSSEPVTVPYENESLFYAIINRQSNHYGFKQEPINKATQQRFKSYCVEPDISVFMTDDSAIKQEIDALAVQGDAMQFADPDFMAEFQQDLERGAFGMPWIVAKLHRLAVAYLNPSNPLAKTDSQRLTNAPLIAVVLSEDDSPPAHIRAGQVFERLWLAASSQNISLQPMTQALQLPQLRQELARIMGISGKYPQQFFRLGYAEREEGIYTHRRPLEDVLIER